MEYQVLWKTRAERQLEDLWYPSTDRTALNAAVSEIDARLHQDAHEQGESREGGRRILIVAPVGVIFKVDEEARTATILNLWQFPQRDR